MPSIRSIVDVSQQYKFPTCFGLFPSLLDLGQYTFQDSQYQNPESNTNGEGDGLGLHLVTATDRCYWHCLAPNTVAPSGRDWHSLPVVTIHRALITNT